MENGYTSAVVGHVQVALSRERCEIKESAVFSSGSSGFSIVEHCRDFSRSELLDSISSIRVFVVCFVIDKG